MTTTLATIAPLVTAAACAAAAVRGRARPGTLVAWSVLALGLVMVGVTGAQRTITFTVFYPTGLVALWLMMGERLPRWINVSVPDAALVVLGTAALGAVAEAGLLDSGRPAQWSVVQIVLLTTTLCLASLSGRSRSVTGWGTAVGLLLMAWGDIWYLDGVGEPLWVVGEVVLTLTAGWACLPRSVEAVERRLPGGPARAHDLVPWGLIGSSVALLGLYVAGVMQNRVSAALALACLVTALVASTMRYSATAGVAARARTSGRAALAKALVGDDPAAPPELRLPTWADETAVLLVDVDRFSEVNHMVGLDGGDRVLTELARRMRMSLRGPQVLVRLGSDEFAVVLPGASPDAAERVAHTLREIVAQPLVLPGHTDVPTRTLHLTAAVGVAAMNTRRGDPADLLQRADLAVHQAKEMSLRGTGDGVVVYTEDVALPLPANLERLDDFRHAMDDGELEVFLQPQVDLITGELVGAEALARWRHPRDGVLLPATFLPLAARMGLTHSVALTVVDRALAAAGRWWALGRRVRVSVNVTAGDLLNPDLPTAVDLALARYRLPGEALCIEIVEEAVLPDPLAVTGLLQRWRAMGVTIAVDDFGTGYSGLSYLKDLPVDELKLDQSFARDLHDPRSETVVRHVAGMAGELALRVVAEGVEEARTAGILAAAGCSIGQGNFFGEAMHPSEFTKLALESTVWRPSMRF